MAPTFLKFALAALLVGVACVRAESHTIRFNNQCGKGTPTLILGGQIVSNGSDYTATGDAPSGIAYLQTGQCGFNGEQCALVEFTLNNPSCPGCGSSVDISLIPPHALNVPTAFSFFNGCDGQGATCNTADCNTAFFQPDDTQVQVGCQTDNVDLLISFCTDGSSSTPASSSSEPAAPTTSAVASSSAAAVAPTTVTFSASAAATSAVSATTEAASAPAAESTEPVLPVSVKAPSSESASFSVPSASATTSALPTRASGKTCKSKSNDNARRSHRRAQVKRRLANA